MHGWKTIKRKLLPRTLFGRSLLIMLTPVLLLQMIVAFVFFDRHWDKMTEKLVMNLAAEIDMVVEDLRAGEDTETALRRAALLDLSASLGAGEAPSTPPPEVLRWFNVDGRLREALAHKLDLPFTLSGADGGRRFAVDVRLDDGRAVRFTAVNKRLTSPTTYIFILWMIGGAAVLFAVAVMFMRNQIRPIRRLAVAAENFGKGHDTGDFKVEGAREVRQASAAFLDMKERLKRQIEQRTAMLAGVSHDLRTPLTRMRLQLALSGDSPEAENLRQDIDEMEKMIEGYLAFARGEGGEAAEMTDVAAVLDRIAANLRRQGHGVQMALCARMQIRVRPLAAERALANVVANACKYATHVWVSAQALEDALEIAVDDDGPGIPAALREEVFRPFYRIEKSRNKKTGGIGLGLSIARDVVHGHGGEIFLEDSDRGGLRVVIRLPF